MASSDLERSNETTRDWVEYLPLHRAILRDDWDTVYAIISEDKDAVTTEIDNTGTPLHIAIGIGENIKLFENLLNMINPESLPSILNQFKGNLLQRAAVVGNTEAAKMLVNKNPRLLFILDGAEDLPIHRAVFNNHQTTYRYLIGACKQHLHLSRPDGYHTPFQGLQGAKLLISVISRGYLDVPTTIDDVWNAQEISDIENQHTNTAFIYSVLLFEYMYDV
ncbi:uncharacterized protein [Rutidosis leptorrhynchoides]|uniref:uncharacterized protein n=1 Tax=Rutidosis leptorrhynchoides TaxID=125765 RepID=UPI003A99D267